MVIESKSGKTRISDPAHPSATGIGRVSGLVNILCPMFVNDCILENELDKSVFEPILCFCDEIF